jgi:hypothetical protein
MTAAGGLPARGLRLWRRMLLLFLAGLVLPGWGSGAEAAPKA